MSMQAQYDATPAEKVALNVALDSMEWDAYVEDQTRRVRETIRLRDIKYPIDERRRNRLEELQAGFDSKR
jgi:hypothetical protein